MALENRLFHHRLRRQSHTKSSIHCAYLTHPGTQELWQPIYYLPSRVWELGKRICLTYKSDPLNVPKVSYMEVKSVSAFLNTTPYSGRASPGRIQLTSQCVWDDLIPEASFISIATHRNGQTSEERLPGLVIRFLHNMYSGSSWSGAQAGTHSTLRVNPYTLLWVWSCTCV